MSNVTDWRHGKNVAQCNRYMLENELYCDITFFVGSGENRQQISAHKNILLSRSEVFEAMLVGPMHEHSSHINIPDVDPMAFRKLLQYMYYDNTKFDENDAYELLYVARKYLVTGLVKRCLERLKTKMSVQNVCVILSYADDEGTVNLCLSYIFRYPSEVLKSDGFKDLSPENIKRIISSNKLGLREEEIFDAILMWSVEECQRQGIDVLPENQCKVLDDVLTFIRYGRMEPDYLLNVCKKFLPQEMYIEIIENIASNIDGSYGRDMESLTVSDVSGARPPNLSCGAEVFPRENWPGYFPMEAIDGTNEASGGTSVPSVFTRRNDRFEMFRFAKNSFASGKSYDMQTADSISFMTSQDVRLLGMFFYGSCSGPGEYEIHLEIFVDIGGHLSLIYSSNPNLTTDGSTKHYKVRIDPIQIQSERVYTIKALIRGPPSYFGTNGIFNVTKNGVSIDFITDDELGLNQTTTEGGQFPGLVFEKPV